MAQAFKEALEKLYSAVGVDKVTQLQTISSRLDSIESSPQLAHVIQSSRLINLIANLMKENQKTWISSFPKFILKIIFNIYVVLGYEIAKNQTTALIQTAKSYYLNKEEGIVEVAPFNIFSYILACSRDAKLLVLSDTEVYYKVLRAAILQTPSTELSVSSVKCLVNASEDCVDWQFTILADKDIVSRLIDMTDLEFVWLLFTNLCQHPDAKALLPHEVLNKAKVGNFPDCTSVYAMLCSEDEAALIKFNSSYMFGLVENLENLITNQTQASCVFEHTLLDLILPLVNLSVADGNKESLGESIIKPLLRVLSIDETNKGLVDEVSRSLTRSKQEAAKTLWNLAFAPSNCKILTELNSESKLKEIFEKTNEGILRRNIQGILYMLSQQEPKKAELTHSSPVGSQGKHLMISYNWGCQPTVLRLARSLKEAGYNVWLDVEQMGGSTLESMANAIENSEVILMCMSQQYKDSPNCRLEGEYCINRKVHFIPLMMQNEYRPDGWLGIALGSKLWYGFWSEEDWESKMTSLIAAIGNRAKITQNNIIAKPSTNLPTHSSFISQVKPTVSWSNEDILEWMKREGIDQHYSKFKEQAFDGKALVELKTLLLIKNSPSFLSFLSDKLSIPTLGDVLRITAALRKLSN